jgi:hypothetical protein
MSAKLLLQRLLDGWSDRDLSALRSVLAWARFFLNRGLYSGSLWKRAFGGLT